VHCGDKDHNEGRYENKTNRLKRKFIGWQGEQKKKGGGKPRKGTRGKISGQKSLQTGGEKIFTICNQQRNAGGGKNKLRGTCILGCLPQTKKEAGKSLGGERKKNGIQVGRERDKWFVSAPQKR